MSKKPESELFSKPNDEWKKEPVTTVWKDPLTPNMYSLMHGRPPILITAGLDQEKHFRIRPYELITELPGYLIEENEKCLSKEELIVLLKGKTDKADEIIAKI